MMKMFRINKTELIIHKFVVGLFIFMGFFSMGFLMHSNNDSYIIIFPLFIWGLAAVFGCLSWKEKNMFVALSEKGLTISGKFVIPWDSIQKVEEEDMCARHADKYMLVVYYVDKEKDSIKKTCITDSIDGYDYVKNFIAKKISRHQR